MRACVNGESIDFLIDTEAAMSVINCRAMEKPHMSSESVKTVGASGIFMREYLSMPLSVELRDSEYQHQHQFLYSDHCPVNLMGRALLCKFGSNIMYKTEDVNSNP